MQLLAQINIDWIKGFVSIETVEEWNMKVWYKQIDGGLWNFHRENGRHRYALPWKVNPYEHIG